MAEAAEGPKGGDLVLRHRLPTRVWHWLNALTVIIMLMSGLMIFNAHPRLYWGKYGANADKAWLQIQSTDTTGELDLFGAIRVPTTGVLGNWKAKDGSRQQLAFPWWATIPSNYSLALGRRWHLFFAWFLVLPGLAFWLWSFARGHFRRDLWLSRAEIRPGHVWQDVKDHLRLRFPVGEAALSYNVLQKASYLGVIFLVLPLLVLTGLTMSPGMDAACPWLLVLFGGRQSARSIHFIMAMTMLAFILVHLLMVLLAGPFNEVRSMITGRYRVPEERA